MATLLLAIRPFPGQAMANADEAPPADRAGLPGSRFSDQQNVESDTARGEGLSTAEQHATNAPPANRKKSEADRSDILIADFEGDGYGDWHAKGIAFGSRPAIANVSPGNRVTGHLGEGLVNTYLTGDGTTGTLTSPPFTIRRQHINFLIGAGNHAGRTCINLQVDGKVILTATGIARKDAAGREIMIWHSWDVSKFAGKEAVLQIVDDARGRWGHINIDHIVQSDVAVQTPPTQDSAHSDYTSPVPRFLFADTQEEQEKQLARNPLLERFRRSRAQLAKDPHHPIFHFTSPENRLNDPNGLSYWNGKWHMFYQGYPPEHPRQHWGHAISDDLIHWRDLPYAIYPGPERACYSGTVYIDHETNRAIALYHGTKAGTMCATSSDPLLLNWRKVTGGAVIPYPKPGEPKPKYNIFDPCIWKKDGWYYALTAGPKGGMQFRSMYLHRSKDLVTWEHLHEFLENDRFSLAGDDGACPYFWPIGTGENQKHILCHFSHMSGGKYMLGSYDTRRDKFVVDAGGDFNFGACGPCGLHAPSAYPDGRGGVNVIFNVNEGKPTRGWNRTMSLPRKLTLRANGLFNLLNVEPAGDVESLRGKHVHIGKMPIPANKEIVLENVHGNSLELMAEFAPRKGQTIELNILRSPDGEEVTRIQCFRDRGMRIIGNRVPPPTVVSIDSSRASTASDVLGRPPETANVDMPRKEPLQLRVFIDRSIVEVFINGRQCVTARVYPSRNDSVGVSLRAQGKDAELVFLDAWQMKSIYE